MRKEGEPSLPGVASSVTCGNYQKLGIGSRREAAELAKRLIGPDRAPHGLFLRGKDAEETSSHH